MIKLKRYSVLGNEESFLSLKCQEVGRESSVHTLTQTVIENAAQTGLTLGSNNKYCSIHKYAGLQVPIVIL